MAPLILWVSQVFSSHAHGWANQDGNESNRDAAPAGASGGGGAGKAQIAKKLTSGSGSGARSAVGDARGDENSLTSALTNYLNFTSRSACGVPGKTGKEAAGTVTRKIINNKDMRCCDSSFKF